MLALPHETPAAEQRDLGWFLICLFLLTPYVASYVMVLLIVPIALLLADADRWEVALLAAVYILLWHL